MNKACRLVICIAAVGAAGALACWPGYSHAWLAFNPTTSAPPGWYIVERPRDLHVDDYVLARLPIDAAALADARHYLPMSVPIMKRVGAADPQLVCVRDGEVLVDSRAAAKALNRDGAGRVLDAWVGCRPLASDEIFLLSLSNPASFDSRYFGPIRKRNVIGKAIPLWTW
jgi:conjugative transfer signal peptidase TraF